MMPQQQTLDYRPPTGLDPTRSHRAAVGVAAAFVAVNLALIGLVLVAPGMEYFFLLGLPFLNFCLLLIALGCTPLAKKYVGGGSVKPYVIASIVSPFVLFFLDIAIFGRLVFPNGIGH